MGRVTYSNGVLRAFIAGLPHQADAVAAKAAAHLEGGAKQRAPVDTGFLRNSIQTENAGTGKRVVSVGADYGPYVEFGTYKMAAQPYFTPAVEDTKRILPALAAAEIHP